jgi:hypothetical protein
VTLKESLFVVEFTVVILLRTLRVEGLVQIDVALVRYSDKLLNDGDIVISVHLYYKLNESLFWCCFIILVPLLKVKLLITTSK